MLKLTYTRERDKFQYTTVIGDPAGIRDLYWQLTKNYKCADGTKIGSIKVTDLEGTDVTNKIMTNPFGCEIGLSNLEY